MTTQGEATGHNGESLEVMKARIQEMIGEGREDELSEEDYQFAVKNGWLEEGLAEA